MSIIQALQDLIHIEFNVIEFELRVKSLVGSMFDVIED